MQQIRVLFRTCAAAVAAVVLLLAVCTAASQQTAERVKRIGLMMSHSGWESGASSKK